MTRRKFTPKFKLRVVVVALMERQSVENLNSSADIN
jgi:hypothetical protein